MTTCPDIKRLSKLGALIRSGRAPAALEAEYDRLDRQLIQYQRERQSGAPAVQTIYDLPVARSMYEADRRQFEEV